MFVLLFLAALAAYATQVTLGVIAFALTIPGDLGTLFENPQAWGLLLGAVTPLITSVVQRPALPSWARATIALVCAIIVGTLTCLINGQIGAGDLITTVGIVIVASHTAYESFFKPTGAAPAVEAATSPRSDL